MNAVNFFSNLHASQISIPQIHTYWTQLRAFKAGACKSGPSNARGYDRSMIRRVRFKLLFLLVCAAASFIFFLICSITCMWSLKKKRKKKEKNVVRDAVASYMTNWPGVSARVRKASYRPYISDEYDGCRSVRMFEMSMRDPVESNFYDWSVIRRTARAFAAGLMGLYVDALVYVNVCLHNFHRQPKLPSKIIHAVVRVLTAIIVFLSFLHCHTHAICPWFWILDWHELVTWPVCLHKKHSRSDVKYEPEPNAVPCMHANEPEPEPNAFPG